MRLWSLHPEYLDPAGLVAVWREGLLAKKVLQGGTKGYTHHPQLVRFRNHPFPSEAIDNYLLAIHYEAKVRGYKFEKSKVGELLRKVKKIEVTDGQVRYEWGHLMDKLKKRNPAYYAKMIKVRDVRVNPSFTMVTGEVESWEKRT